MQLINPAKVYHFPSFVEENISAEMQKEMLKQEFNLLTELHSVSKTIKEELSVDFCTVYLNKSNKSYVIFDDEKISLNKGDLFLFNTKINIFPKKQLPQFFFDKTSEIIVFNWTQTHEIISL